MPHAESSIASLRLRQTMSWQSARITHRFQRRSNIFDVVRIIFPFIVSPHREGERLIVNFWG
jgi:hypothetical protein